MKTLPVPVPVLVLLGTLATVNCELHSLTYIYTALSRPVGVAGVHQFTAMGVLDGRSIDYFDSETQVKVPKQQWMKDRLPAYYWEKGSDSRRSKQQWFKVNMEILMNRMRQNDSDVHVLQWQHGCEAELRPDGELSFHRGMDAYNYDGEDFLSFDDAHQVWVAPTEAALPTKRKWDNVPVLKEYTRGYLKNECMDWLKKFLNYSQNEMKTAKKPEVFVYAVASKDPSNMVLHCLATGFYPREITLRIRRNGRVLAREDGLTSSGVRPNDDDTFQIRDSVEILRSDRSTYTCEVIHPATELYHLEAWDHFIPEPESSGPSAIIAVAAAVSLVIVGVALVLVLVLLKRKGFLRRGGRAGGGARGGGGADPGAEPLRPAPAGSKGSLDSDNTDSGVSSSSSSGRMLEDARSQEEEENQCDPV